MKFPRGLHDRKKVNFDQNLLDPKNKNLKKIVWKVRKCAWHKSFSIKETF